MGQDWIFTRVNSVAYRTSKSSLPVAAKPRLVDTPTFKFSVTPGRCGQVEKVG
jgi:hypothetical protein